jgi:hypothetical protein
MLRVRDGLLRTPGWRVRRRAAGTCAVLCVTLVVARAGAIESTECATAMSPPPASLPLSDRQLAVAQRNLRATSAAAAGLDIELVPDAGLAANPDALDAFRRAAAQWAAVISTPVTVTIGAGLADLGDPNLIGQTRPTSLTGSYTRVRDAIVAVHQDEPVVTAMPSAAQFTASIRTGFSLDGNLSATKATLKALGFTDLDAMFGSSDATITFNSRFSFDFDNRDGVSADTIDFETVAAHEIGHVLGFSSSVDVIDTLSPRPVRLEPLDLLRFADAPGADPSTPAEFTTFPRSLVPGVEAVLDDTSAAYRMSTGTLNGDGRQASHWKDDRLTGTLIGIMDPTLPSATIETVSAADERALELIGWTIVGRGGTVTSTTQPAIADTSTTTTSSTTSTTLPPCVTARCRLDDALHQGACDGATIPTALANRLERAIGLGERAATQSGKKARRTLARGRQLLASAGRLAQKEARGRRAKLTTGCASVIRDAIDQQMSSSADPGMPRSHNPPSSH